MSVARFLSLLYRRSNKAKASSVHQLQEVTVSVIVVCVDEIKWKWEAVSGIKSCRHFNKSHKTKWWYTDELTAKMRNQCVCVCSGDVLWTFNALMNVLAKRICTRPDVEENMECDKMLGGGVHKWVERVFMPKRRRRKKNEEEKIEWLGNQTCVYGWDSREVEVE